MMNSSATWRGVRHRYGCCGVFSLQRQHAELRAALELATARVLGAGYFILGAEVEKFEHDFAAYVGVKHAVGVGNGLEALGLLLKALRVGPGDEVIVPGHTFIATWLAAEQVGATVVPVDVDPVNYNIDPAQVRMAITSRTRAIIAVHLYGQPAEMNSLDEISKEHGIPVLEDAAQAHGATLDGRKTGGLSLAAAFSFYPTKNLGALGDGGAVTTDDDALAASIRSLRNYGSSVKYRHDELGGNSRLDELQASFLNVKLAGLDNRNEKRRIIATRYSSKLSGVTGVAVPQVAARQSSLASVRHSTDPTGTSPGRAEPTWHSNDDLLPNSAPLAACVRYKSGERVTSLIPNAQPSRS